MMGIKPNPLHRINEIDVASGLAIILVVVGHTLDHMPESYRIFKTVLYTFHMPFFMFISGFLYRLSSQSLEDLKSYLPFIKRKLNRLGLTYLLVSLLYLGFNFILYQHTGSVNILQDVLYIFLKPSFGVSIFLWYIYVLLLFYLFFSLLLLHPILKKNTYILIILGFMLYFIVPKIGLFELNLFCKYFVYFSIGIFISENYHCFKVVLHKMNVLPCLLFAVLLVLEILDFVNLPALVYGLISIPSLVYISLKLSINKSLQYLGNRTFVIYIWHSAFLFFLEVILMKFDKNYHTHRIFYFPLFISLALLGPLFLRYLSRKFKIQLLYRLLP